ncbi:AI-2E family transporter [Oscillatoria amoena NRMC-F 0135]|nr:AI-2E family transporter [Oscillatoria amoena NRMC-F 0135]
MKLIDWVSFLGLIVSLIVLWQFRNILLLVFTAIVLAIALNSLVRFLNRRCNIPRGAAVWVALLLVLIGFSILMGLILPLFISQFQQLILLVPQGVERFIIWANRNITNPPTWWPSFDIGRLPRFNDISQQLIALVQQVFGNFFVFFSGSVAIVLQVLLAIVLTLMFVSNPPAYRRLLLRLFPSFYRRRADDILAKCEVSLLAWLRGIAINSLFVATASAVGLMVLGVPFVFAHAVVAGVFNFIPNIGPMLSVVFPVSVAFLDSFGKAIAVIILYAIVQNIESYLIAPMVMQQQVSLLPAATLVAQIFFATFLGPVGLILALPLAVVSKTWIEEAILKDVFDRWPEKDSEALPEPIVTPEAIAAIPPSEVSQTLPPTEPPPPENSSEITHP